MRPLLLSLLAFTILATGCEQKSKAPKPPKREIVEYSASWCGPCQEAKPKVRRLGIPIREVDCSKRFPNHVTSVPYYEVYENGKLVGKAESFTALILLLKALGWVLPLLL